MCAAGLPVCLTRAPKPILHPPPVSKSDIKPVPGVSGICRKTKKKHLKRSKEPLEGKLRHKWCYGVGPDMLGGWLEMQRATQGVRLSSVPPPPCHCPHARGMGWQGGFGGARI